MRVAEPDTAGVETEVEVNDVEMAIEEDPEEEDETALLEDDTAELYDVVLVKPVDAENVDSLELDDEMLELVVLTVEVAVLEIEELVATVLVEAMTELELEGDGHAPQPHLRASFRT